MKKTYFFLILPAMLLFLAGCGNKNLTNKQNNINNQNQAAAPAATKTYTLTDVAAHNTTADCWQAIDGQVYNLSAYIASGQHPNNKINDGCGKDATAMFNQVAKHNGKAKAMLPEFLIGTLQQ